MVLEIGAATETAYQKFRDRWVRNMDVLQNGGDGSIASNGNTLSAIRSVLQKSATLIGSVIESLDGELTPPDVDALLSYAESLGMSQEDFTCTVLSMLTLLDGAYSMTTGESDLVLQIFADFNRGQALRNTLASTPLKMRTTTGGIISVAKVEDSSDGKNGKVVKKETKKKRRSTKPSVKKQRKVTGKKAVKKKKKSGTRKKG